LYVSKPLAPESVAQATHVSQDGVLVTGSVSLSGNGQALTFHPDQPFRSDALIEVFLDNSAHDTSGIPVFSYSGTFHTRVDAATSPPSVLSLSASGTSNVPVNAALDVLFSEPLDPASVTPANFVLRDFVTNQIVASTASLIKGGRVVRVQPQNPMTAVHTHSIQVQTGVRDLNGQGPVSAQNLFFVTSTVAVVDAEPPHVLAKGPADGTSGVGINSQAHWRFDEPMNPLSLVPDSDAAVTLFWSDNNRDLRVARDEPYAANTTVTESIADAQDNAGNSVLGSVSTTFTTGSAANITRPNRVDSTPFSAATNVPVNAVVHVLLDTMVDPVTVNPSTSFLRDSQTGTNVPGSPAVELDGRTITIVPTEPLAISHTFTIHTDSIGDLSGNVNPFVATSSFTTSAVPDTQPPTVTAISLADGQGGVPTNAPLSVTFSEPIDALKLSGVTLRQNGQAVPATLNVSADHRTLTFKLVQPLTANTAYALSVSGVEDLSGNALAQASAVGFTTGPGADL
jgi:hypothetical protein